MRTNHQTDPVGGIPGARATPPAPASRSHGDGAFARRNLAESDHARLRRENEEEILAHLLNGGNRDLDELVPYLLGGDVFSNALRRDTYGVIVKLGIGATYPAVVSMLAHHENAGAQLSRWMDANPLIPLEVAVKEAQRLLRTHQREQMVRRAHRLTEDLRNGGDLRETVAEFEQDLAVELASGPAHVDIVIRCAEDEEHADIEEPPSILGAGFWPAKSPRLSSAREGIGKTWSEIEFAVAYVSGKRFFGLETNPKGGRILMISPELGPYQFRERLRAVIDGFDFDDASRTEVRSRIQYITREDWMPSGRLDTGDGDTILRFVERARADVVILDPLYRFHADIMDFTALLALVDDRIPRETGATVGLSHHHRKSSQQRDKSDMGSRPAGRFDLMAAVKCHMALDVFKEDANEGIEDEDADDDSDRDDFNESPKFRRRILQLTFAKSNDAPLPKPIYLEHDPESGRLIRSKWRPKDAGKAAVRKIQEGRIAQVRALASSRKDHVISRADVQTAFGIKSKESALNLIRAAGFVERRKDGRTQLYGFAKPPRPDSFDSFDDDSFAPNDSEDVF